VKCSETPVRHSPGLLALVLLAAGAGSPSPAHAQIYTRVNASGVLEATNVPDEPDFRLTYQGKGTVIHSRGFRRNYDGRYDRHIADAAASYNVPLDLVRAVIQVESEYDANAVSSKGAQGLMQLMPFTARRFGVVDAFDPRQNIFGGVQYLRVLLDLFQGDVALALAGYNAGENAVQRFRGIPPYRETRGYVQKIQGILGGTIPAMSYTPRVASAASTGAPAAVTHVLAYAPSDRLGVTNARLKVSRAERRAVVPARPRTYYKWVDERGSLHVTNTPPLAEGQAYTMIRALD
jgi:hypothetical protein